ncbi:MAG: hypothetical protein GY926_19060 [bacterium]|nr:hypothetical protein [bacterium]
MMKKPLKRPLIALLLGGCVAVASCSTAVPDETSADAPAQSTPRAEPSVEQDAASEAPSVVELVAIDSPQSIISEGGHIFSGDVDPSKMADYSEVAIRGQVVRIGDSRTTTRSGDWERLENPDQILSQRANMQILTALEVRVLEVIGSRSDTANAPSPGDLLTTHVLGGTFSFTVTPKEAEITGFRPDLSDEDEQKVIESGQEPDPDKPQPVPDEPFDVSLSLGYRVTLTEGDEVIAFVRDHPLWDPVANDGSWLDAELTFPVHPVGFGIFVRQDARTFRDATGESLVSEEELLVEARSLASERGEPPVADIVAPTRQSEPSN